MAVGLAICHGLMMTPIDVLKNKYPTDDKWQGSSFVVALLLSFDFGFIRPIETESQSIQKTTSDSKFTAMNWLQLIRL